MEAKKVKSIFCIVRGICVYIYRESNVKNSNNKRKRDICR